MGSACRRRARWGGGRDLPVGPPRPAARAPNPCLDRAERGGPCLVLPGSTQRHQTSPHRSGGFRSRCAASPLGQGSGVPGPPVAGGTAEDRGLAAPVLRVAQGMDPAVRVLAPRPLAANLAAGRGQDERGGEQGGHGDEHQLPAVVGRRVVRRGQGVGGRRRDILLGRARGGLDGALGDAVGGRRDASGLDRRTDAVSTGTVAVSTGTPTRSRPGPTQSRPGLIRSLLRCRDWSRGLPTGARSAAPRSPPTASQPKSLNLFIGPCL